jgi:Protein of unknown function (DUF4232)
MTIGAAALVSVLAGGCGSSAGGGHHVRPVLADRRPSAPAGSAAPSAVTRLTVRRCPARALVLRPGTFVSPMTGEHAVMYALTNRSPVTCTLIGYPKVTLYDARGAVLPFRYTKGGSAYATRAKPVTVVLAHGASAYVLVAKYRCDVGDAREATAIRLTLPASHGAAFAGREAVGGPGTASLSYCRGGRRDPGQAIAVSPIEATQQATSSIS